MQMPNPPSEEVTITRAEYQKLTEDSITLNKLYRAGVDNWEWYDDAISEEN